MENKFVFDYLTAILPMLPIIIMTYFFIKIVLYWLFIRLLNSIVFMFDLFAMVQ